jgi:hypothetical protein
MRICRITIDVVYTDDAKGALKSEQAVHDLIDRVLDPELDDYTGCTRGVRIQRVDFPDPAKGRGKFEAWHRYADEQIALFDVERFAVTRAVDAPVPMQREIRKTSKTTKTTKATKTTKTGKAR